MGPNLHLNLRPKIFTQIFGPNLHPNLPPARCGSRRRSRMRRGRRFRNVPRRPQALEDSLPDEGGRDTRGRSTSGVPPAARPWIPFPRFPYPRLPLHSQRAEIRGALGSGGLPISGPIRGPASGHLLMLEVCRGNKSPFIPYVRLIMARHRLHFDPIWAAAKRSGVVVLVIVAGRF